MAKVSRTLSSSAPRKRLSAQQRSEALLRALLPAEVYAHWIQRGYIEVSSPSHPNRIYRIPRAGFVWVFEQGEPVELLCIGPIEPLPQGDVILMHKLLIEADEATYRATANHLPLGLGGWPAAEQLARLVPLPW